MKRNVKEFHLMYYRSDRIPVSRCWCKTPQWIQSFNQNVNIDINNICLVYAEVLHILHIFIMCVQCYQIFDTFSFVICIATNPFAYNSYEKQQEKGTGNLMIYFSTSTDWNLELQFYSNEKPLPTFSVTCIDHKLTRKSSLTEVMISLPLLHTSAYLMLLKIFKYRFAMCENENGIYYW